jgi:hypothetical protein
MSEGPFHDGAHIVEAIQALQAERTGRHVNMGKMHAIAAKFCMQHNTSKSVLHGQQATRFVRV